MKGNPQRTDSVVYQGILDELNQGGVVIWHDNGTLTYVSGDNEDDVPDVFQEYLTVSFGVERSDLAHCGSDRGCHDRNSGILYGVRGIDIRECDVRSE
jgi:hypothetical protein